MSDFNKKCLPVALWKYDTTEMSRVLISSVRGTSSWATQGRACVGTINTYRITYCSGRTRTEVIDNSTVATIQGTECLIANGLNVVLTLFTLIGFIMFVYGAIMFMLSGGQPQKMEKAKDTITYVIVGLILAISSFVIINIISAFTGVGSIMTIQWAGST
jgi:hypothetical protein